MKKEILKLLGQFAAIWIGVIVVAVVIGALWTYTAALQVIGAFAIIGLVILSIMKIMEKREK